jgi:hypothetical protein
MAGKGMRFKFHGAFGSKQAALRKERRRKHSHILSRKIHGKRRYIVVTNRNG